MNGNTERGSPGNPGSEVGGRQTTRKKQTKVVTGTARPPITHLKKFNNEHYQLYDLNNP